MRPVLAAALALVAAAPAGAQSLGVSLGAHTPGAAGGAVSVGVEYRGAARALRGDWTGGWLLAARANDLGDGWAGVGYGVHYPLDERWHVEGSFAAGVYRAGATDLGHRIEFRTQIGIGVALTQDTQLLLVAEHLSNGGLGASNPGSNMVMLMLRRAF